MKKNIVFGYVPSTMDGTEYHFTGEYEQELPSEYSYREYLPPVLNQGELSICVPCSVSAFLNWKENLKDGTSKDNNISLMDIYNSRSNKGEGMTFKDALKFLRHKGVKSKNGKLKINSYALVHRVRDLQYALVMNGPCVGALPVWSNNDNFWVDEGGNFMGYHAISIVGYSENGFIIRNSWGKSFGENGYVTIPYNQFANIMEIWTIMS